MHCLPMTSAVRLAPYLMLAWGLFLFLQGIEAPQPPDLPDPADPETATDYDTDEEGLPAMPRAPPEIPYLLDDPEPVNENPGRHQTEVVDLPVLRRGQTQILPEPQPAQGERPPRSMGQQSNVPLLVHEHDALQHPPQAQGVPGPRDLLHDPDLPEREPGPHDLLHDSDLPDQDPMPFPDPPRHDLLLPPRPRLQEDPALPVLRHRGPGPRDPLHTRKHATVTQYDIKFLLIYHRKTPLLQRYPWQRPLHPRHHPHWWTQDRTLSEATSHINYNS